MMGGKLDIRPIADLVLRLNMEFERQGLDPVTSIEVTPRTGDYLRVQPLQDLINHDYRRCAEAGYATTIVGIPFYMESKL